MLTDGRNFKFTIIRQTGWQWCFVLPAGHNIPQDQTIRLIGYNRIVTEQEQTILPVIDTDPPSSFSHPVTAIRFVENLIKNRTAVTIINADKKKIRKFFLYHSQRPGRLVKR